VKTVEHTEKRRPIGLHVLRSVMSSTKIAILRNNSTKWIKKFIISTIAYKKTHHEMRIPKHDVTYTYLCSSGTSISTHKMDHTQDNLINLIELHFAEYILYTDVRIADLCSAPYILIPEVWKKFPLRHCPPQSINLYKYFCTESEYLFIATWASDLTFLALFTSEIYTVLQIGGPKPLLGGPKWYSWILRV